MQASSKALIAFAPPGRCPTTGDHDGIAVLVRVGK
jgi:hypothetical protein